jgi:hypothetical protein
MTPGSGLMKPVGWGSMEIIPFDNTNPRQVRAFLDLPFRLYRDTPQWVPPLEMDIRRMLNHRKHPFYKHSEASFFMSRRDGQVTGRIAVLNNHNYNNYNKERSAFFYLFECENEIDTAVSLCEACFDWARKRGLDRIIGPKGFTAFDGLGLLVKGFEHRPALGLPYNLDYYASLVEAAGFEPGEELVSGYLSSHIQLPEKIHRASEIIQRRRGLRVARYQRRSDLRALVPKLQALYNGALSGTSGNVPLTDDEVKTLADQLLWFADPKLIKIIFKGVEPVGFLFAYPDISAALQRTRGRILPLGWITLLREMHKTKWVNINGAGIIDHYRGLGGTAILFSEMYKSVTEGDFEHAEIVQIGRKNGNMLRELRDLGIDFYKSHRLYFRTL